MFPTARGLITSLAVAAVLTACADNDVVSPNAARNRELVSLSGGSSTGGGSTNTGGGTSTGGGGGGGGKTSCTNTLSVAATATEALSGNAFQASYVLVNCQSKTRVWMSATDLATNQTVWQSQADLAGTVAFWTLPYKNSTYRINAFAVAGSANTIVATASTTVSTMDVLPCDMMLTPTTTTGYWGIYAAVWVAIDSRDCGLGDTHTSLRITNLNSGVVALDYPNLPNSTMIDFEGSIVAYDTPYRVETQLVRSNGEVVLSKSEDIRSTVLR